MVAHEFVGAHEDTIRAGNVYQARFGDDELLHIEVAIAHHALGHLERALQHYEKAMAVSYQPAFLGAGLLLDQMGERERAEEAWRRGVEILEPTLDAFPDDARTATYLACYYGLLGEHSSFLAQERVVIAGGPHFDAFWDLVAIEARIGRADRAVELMRDAVRRGSLSPRWPLTFQIASVPIPSSEAMDAFRREYESLDRRLRELY